MKKENTRCPLQAECERKCLYEGHELDCAYYDTNGIGENGIPDQEKRREQIERRKDAEWEEAQMAALLEDEDGDLPGQEEPVKPCAPAEERTPQRIGAETAPAGAFRSATDRREALGAEIRNLTYQAKCMTVYYGVEIGRRLVEAKQMVGHGAWGDWVKKETEFSQSTATRFMRVFEEYGSEQIGIFGAVENSSTLQNISISNALRLLAVPKEEREEFAAEVDAEHISARELERAIRERDEARSTAEAAKAEAATAEKSRAKMEADMAALKNLQQSAQEAEEEARRELEEVRAELQAIRDKPVEVAVEVDEAAVSKAAAEAKAATEAEWKEKLAAAKRKLDDAASEKRSLEDKLQELRKKVKSAGEAGEQDRERLSAEVEALKKQLTMSQTEIVTFKAKLETMNASFAGVKGALLQMDEETQTKMKTAVLAQFDLWKKELV